MELLIKKFDKKQEYYKQQMFTLNNKTFELEKDKQDQFFKIKLLENKNQVLEKENNQKLK